MFFGYHFSAIVVVDILLPGLTIPVVLVTDQFGIASTYGEKVIENFIWLLGIESICMGEMSLIEKRFTSGITLC